MLFDCFRIYISFSTVFFFFYKLFEKRVFVKFSFFFFGNTVGIRVHYFQLHICHRVCSFCHSEYDRFFHTRFRRTPSGHFIQILRVFALKYLGICENSLRTIFSPLSLRLLEKGKPLEDETEESSSTKMRNE